MNQSLQQRFSKSYAGAILSMNLTVQTLITQLIEDHQIPGFSWAASSVAYRLIQKPGI